MPSLRCASRCRSGAFLATAALVLLVACSDTLDGIGRSKHRLPDVAYDVARYLFPHPFPRPQCERGVTPQQTDAVRTRLFADPATAEVLYLSERATYQVAKQVLPAKVSALS